MATATSNTYSGTLGAAATTVDFPLAYASVVVVNRGGGEMYVRTDGVDPVADADGVYTVLPNSTTTFPIPNKRPNAGGLPSAYQTLQVRIAGTATQKFTLVAG